MADRQTIQKLTVSEKLLIAPNAQVNGLNVNHAQGLKSALDRKIWLESPTFTGTPTAPTPNSDASGNQIANAEFVNTVIQAAVDNLVGGAPGALDTLKEISDAINNDASFNTTVIGYLAGKLDTSADEFGGNAVAIGNSAGVTNQPANTIIINASGLPLNGASGVTGSFYVNPVNTRTTGSAFNVLMYDTINSEIIRSAGSSNFDKTFVIDHPIHADKYLVHACLEGPESGVYYRGKGQIVNNLHATIQLPEYVDHLATEFTIQISPVYSGKKMETLSAGSVENNSFTVYGENCEFYWHVTGKRKDINVEPLKDTTTVKGSGPYKWVE